MIGGSWCICSFYAPHAGVPIDARLSFWRNFVHNATRIHHSVGLPMIIAGDANVWYPHFRLRTRPLRFIGPSFCGLVDIIMQFGDSAIPASKPPTLGVKRVELRLSSSPEVREVKPPRSPGLWRSILVHESRQFVVLCTGQIASCALHNRCQLPDRSSSRRS